MVDQGDAVVDGRVGGLVCSTQVESSLAGLAVSSGIAGRGLAFACFICSAIVRVARERRSDRAATCGQNRPSPTASHSAPSANSRLSRRRLPFTSSRTGQLIDPALSKKIYSRRPCRNKLPRQRLQGWNWSDLAMKFWMLIVVIGLLRTAAGVWRLRQLVARSTEPSDAVSTVAARLASALQLAAPTVRVTDEISSPSVVGLLRPVILLPNSIAESKNPQTLASALSHELAHIAANDLRWDAVLRLFHLFGVAASAGLGNASCSSSSLRASE